MTLIKNFKLRERGGGEKRGEHPCGAVESPAWPASPNNQAKVKRIKKFISTFIVTLRGKT